MSFSGKKVLKGTDPDVACGHAGQDGARAAALHGTTGFTGGHGGECPRGRHISGPPWLLIRCIRASLGQARRARRPFGNRGCGPEPFSCTSNRAPSGATTSPKRIARPSPKLGRPATELVPGIDLGQGIGAAGHRIARKGGDAVVRRQRPGVQTKAFRQRAVQSHQLWAADGRRRHAGVKPCGQAAIGIVEGQIESHTFTSMASGRQTR